MLQIYNDIAIDERDIEFGMIRAQGAGGQNVNKVSSAVHLRFSIPASSLPPEWKDALLALGDRRISKDGVVVIKAQSYRSQEKNRADALERLVALLASVAVTAPPRRPTRPTRASQRRRVERKTERGQTKRLRGKVQETP